MFLNKQFLYHLVQIGHLNELQEFYYTKYKTWIFYLLFLKHLLAKCLDDQLCLTRIEQDINSHHHNSTTLWDYADVTGWQSCQFSACYLISLGTTSWARWAARKTDFSQKTGKEKQNPNELWHCNFSITLIIKSQHNLPFT